MLKKYLVLLGLFSFTALSAQRISDSLNYEAMRTVYEVKNQGVHYYNESLDSWIIYESDGTEGLVTSFDSKRNMPPKNGDYLEYDSKFRLRFYGSYEKDKEEGLFIYFDTLGSVLRTTHFHKGKLEGEAKSYYSNGAVRISQDYKNNLKDGTLNGFYPSGARLYTGKYKKGKMLGQRWYYEENGNPADGNKVWYHENGRVKLKGTCINGLPEGRFSHFNDKGELELYVDYMKGLPHGAYIKFKDGKVEYKDCYYLGKYDRGAQCK